MLRFAALLLLASAAYAVQIPYAWRQATADDVIGLFNAATSLGAKCPGSIEHTATANTADEVPHANMIMNGNKCSGGAMDVITLEAAQSLFTEGSRKNILNIVADSGEKAIYGVENSGRKCGDGSNDNLSAGTLVVILKPSTNLDFGIASLFPNFRYMIVDDPTIEGICVYRANLRPSTSPSPSVSASVPAASAGASPSVSISAAASVGPSTGGDPSPSASAVPPSPSVPSGAGNGGGTGGTGGAGPGPGTDNGSDNAEPSPTDEVSEEPSQSPPGSPSSTPTSSGDGDDDDGSVCFPAEASVELENGSIKMMKEVVIGDRVKVAQGVFSDVFMFTHKDSSTVHSFVTLKTAAGSSVSATEGHYIYVNGNLAMAKSVKVGDVLELGNGANTIVTSVEMSRKTGLFNPQTVHGDIIVDNVRASTFTRTIKPAVAQVMLSPLRLLYHVTGLSGGFLESGASRSVTDVMPHGEITM